MVADVAYARGMLAGARQMFVGNTKSLTLEEALFTGEGYRSSFGLVKHIGGWLHVYRSYAFDAEPRHWAQADWPRGLVDTIEPTNEYWDELRAWVQAAFDAWDRDLKGMTPGALEEPRPAHFGGTLPLATIVGIQVQHVAYHTGELNMLLSIKRGEAWEYGEEVEENHVSTFGHGVPPNWMSPDQQSAHEAKLRAAHEARSR